MAVRAEIHDDCDVGDNVQAPSLWIMMIVRDSKAASPSCETLTVCKHDISLAGCHEVHQIVKCWV
jgi:hypothetical protein